MSTPSTPPVPPTPPPNADQPEILKYLREEAEANRKAQRGESDANRKLFLDTSKIVAIPLAVLLTLAGIFFYHDVNTMKDAMVTQGKAAADAEVMKMDGQIDDTLKDKFKSENIQHTIQDAAETATREQAPGLIKEVITPEVRKAVEGQSGTIRDVATHAATEQVKGVIDPIVADVQVQGVIARANADDAHAFDELLATRDSGSQSRKDMVNNVIENLQRSSSMTITDGMHYEECTSPTGADYQQLITSPLVAVKKDAIGDCVMYISMGQWAPKSPRSVSAFTIIETVAPVWMKVALEDKSLTVRAQAISALNSLFKGGYGVPNNGFDLLDTYFLRDWWKKNGTNQAAIALIAYANDTPPGAMAYTHEDQIGLYDEVERLSKNSGWGSELQQLLEQMRVRAANVPSAAFLSGAMGRSCSDAEKDLAIRLLGYRNSLETERVENYGLMELQYLDTACPVPVDETLTKIAEYGVATRILSRRWAAVGIVKKAVGTNLNQYETKPLGDWLKAHH